MRAGCPRTIREWVRGTGLASALVVFEGEKSHIAVSANVDDQRVRGRGIYKIRTRAITHQITKFWIRRSSTSTCCRPDNIPESRQEIRRISNRCLHQKIRISISVAPFS
mmetsp:Transcript_21241/g.59119  ORF Transcript_21241/g.59119 Transcript_21241/m.59119 type:complete len:109 (-) Transcript_21241:767-1093(-)